jgi:hypothetical protein
MINVKVVPPVDTSSMASSSSNNIIPNWKVSGDFFDVCKCNIPCPCEFAQAPTYGDCDGVLAWHIKKGQMVKHQLMD